jgi:hypothetical protein
MKLLLLVNAPGVFAMVSDEDFERLRSSTWYLTTRKNRNTQYVYRLVTTPEGKTQSERLHRVVMGLGPTGVDDVHVDHIDGNGLNNQRENLRRANCSQNFANKGLRKDSQTGHMGVSPHKRSGKFKAAVCYMKVYYYLGLYSIREEAAFAYNCGAAVLHGEYAQLNRLTPGVVSAERQEAIRQGAITKIEEKRRHSTVVPTGANGSDQHLNRVPDAVSDASIVEQASVDDA